MRGVAQRGDLWKIYQSGADTLDNLLGAPVIVTDVGTEHLDARELTAQVAASGSWWCVGGATQRGRKAAEITFR